MANISAPATCFSSQLTTHLMLFRNPHGSEENWVFQESLPYDRNRLMGRAVVAEIGSALLVVVSSVEGLAYVVLLLPAACTLPWTKRPCRLLMDRFESSYFTVSWNLCNCFGFNIRLVNICTNESFARHAVDTSPYAAIAKTSFKALGTLFTFASLFTGIRNAGQIFDSLSKTLDQRYFRGEHRVQIFQLIGDQAANLHLSTLPTLTGRLRDLTINTDRAVNEGVEFIKTHFLADGQLTPVTKAMMDENDPDIFSFLSARAIYLYAFGPLKEEPIPSFFQASTQTGITRLRPIPNQETTSEEKLKALDQEKKLEEAMKDFALFQQEHADIKATFNTIKEIGYNEFQGGIFFSSCWLKAKQTPLLISVG